MKTTISIASGLSSRFNIGDEVLLYFGIPDGIGSDLKIPSAVLRANGAPRCKIVAVKFDSGKVMYDLAVFTVDSDGKTISGYWYENRPLRDVDSYFVYSILQ